MENPFQFLAEVFESNGCLGTARVSPSLSGASRRKSRPVKRIITEEEKVIQEEREEVPPVVVVEEEIEQPPEKLKCPAMQVDASEPFLASLRQFVNNELLHQNIQEDEGGNTSEEPVTNGNHSEDMEQIAGPDFLKKVVDILQATDGTLGATLNPHFFQQQLAALKESVETPPPPLNGNLNGNGNGLLTPVTTPLSPLFTSPESINSPEKLLQAIMTPSLGFLGNNGLGASNTGLLSSPLIAPSPTLLSLMNTPTHPTASPTPKKAENRPPVVSQTLKASKRRLFDDTSKIEAASMSGEDRIDMNELEAFAQTFKKQRIKFGFTQGDVGVALGKRYGTDFSQTTISRFEALNLSFKNMCKLRPLLKEWLADVEMAIEGGATVTDLIDKKTLHNGNHHGGHHNSETPEIIHSSISSVTASSLMSRDQHVKRRRKRTNLDMNQRNALDTFFALNPRPDHDKMTDIANTLELDRDVVRVWFCNRRQKMRRVDEPAEGEMVTPSVSPVFPHMSSMTAMEQIQEAARLASCQASNEDSDGTSGSPEAASNDGCSDL